MTHAKTTIMDTFLDYMVLITHQLMDVCWNIAYETNTGQKNLVSENKGNGKYPKFSYVRNIRLCKIISVKNRGCPKT